MNYKINYRLYDYFLRNDFDYTITKAKHYILKDNYSKAIILLENLKFVRIDYNCFMLLGISYFYKNDFYKSLFYLKKAENMCIYNYRPLVYQYDIYKFLEDKKNEIIVKDKILKGNFIRETQELNGFKRKLENNNKISTQY